MSSDAPVIELDQKPAGETALLDIRGLKTHFTTDVGIVHAVDGVDLTVGRGETVCVVGESGCGKTVTALSVLKLIAMPPGRIAGGQILWQGRDLVPLAADEMNKIRAREIAIVFQEPMTSLNPVYTIGDQIGEVIALHEGLSRRAVLERTIEMLALVQIPNPKARVNDYPHQFSGGMRQRVMIAMALSCRPKAADRRRTDHGARCHDPGADPGSAAGHEIPLRHVDHADHSRHGRRRRGRATGRGDVCGQGGGGSLLRAVVRKSPPSLYPGLDPLDPAPRSGGGPQDPPADDRGRRAEADRSAGRLPLRAALQFCDG
jgi:ABC-type lipoprotein export system ATPase subunit